MACFGGIDHLVDLEHGGDRDRLAVGIELGDRVYIIEKGMVRYQGSMAAFLGDADVRQAYLAV